MSTMDERNDWCSSAAHRMEVESCSRTVENYLHVPDDDRDPRPAPIPISKPTITIHPQHQEERNTSPINTVNITRPTKTMTCDPTSRFQGQGGSDNKKINNFSWKMGTATPTSVSCYPHMLIHRELSTNMAVIFDWDASSRRPLMAPFPSTDHDDGTCLASNNIAIAPLLRSVSSKNALITKDHKSIVGGMRDETMIRLETPVKKKNWISSQVQQQQQQPSPWKAAHPEIKHRNDHDFFQSVLESPSRDVLAGLVTPPLLQRATSLVDDMHVAGDMGEIDLLSELPYS